MIVINAIFLLVLGFTGNTNYFMNFQLFIQPITICWCLLIVEKANDSIDKNEKLTNDFEIALVSKAVIEGLIVIFISFGIVAFISLIYSTHIFNTNLYGLLTLEIIISIIISLIPKVKRNNEIIVNNTED